MHSLSQSIKESRTISELVQLFLEHPTLGNADVLAQRCRGSLGIPILRHACSWPSLKNVVFRYNLYLENFVFNVLVTLAGERHDSAGTSLASRKGLAVETDRM